MSCERRGQAQRGLPTSPSCTRSRPAGVSIETKQKVAQRRLNVPPGVDENDPFYDFFRRFGPRGQQRDRDIEVPGSAPVHRQCRRLHRHQHHVVEDADEVACPAHDKREYKAR
jgi:serine protease Do